MKALLLSALAPLLLALPALAGPYDAWTRYRTISVNTTAAGANVATAQADFPLLVRLTNESAATGKNALDSAKAGGADIRFTDNLGNNALSYEIERWSPTGAEIWVKVPNVMGNDVTTIRMYWGNSAAVSASNGSAVFDTANGYEAVFHMNQAPGDTLRDVSANGYKGVPTVGSTPGSTAPADSAGAIGVAKHFGGNVADNADSARKGGAYRLETATGARTNNAFDYVGNDAQFTISTWTKFTGYTAAFSRRRGMVTKADHGAGQIDNNDPTAQWFLRPSSADRVMHFQRFTQAGYGTAPYSIVASGGIASAAGNWNYSAFAATGATAGNNLFFLRNGASRTTRAIGDEAGVHRDIDVFIGGFADSTGKKGSGTHFLNGALDEVRIQKVARSADWLDLEFQTQRADSARVTLGPTQVQVATVGPWSAWTQSRAIRLNTGVTGANVAGAVRDFPVLVRLTSAEASIFTQAKAGGADVRFAKSNDSSLPYQIERWDAANNRAEIWVKVDTVKGNDSAQSIRMYWGNSAATSASNGTKVFDTAGYVSAWHLGDSTGRNPRPNAIAGRFAATPVSFAAGYGPRAGVIGLADSLSGGSNADSTTFLKVNEGTPSALYNFPAGAFSYSAWINPATVDNFARFISLTGTDAGQDRIFLAPSGGNLVGRVWGTTSHATNSTTAIVPGEWQHIAMTVSRGTTVDTTRLYHNGVEAAMATHAPMTNAERNYVRIGKDYINTADATYNGKIDEARLSQVTRSADYVKLSWASQGAYQKFTNIGVTAASAPSAPSNVAGISGAPNSATIIVNWSAPASNGGSPLTAYTATAAPGGATCTAVPPATTCNVTGLTPGSGYTFTVTAANANGTSQPSAVSSQVSTPLGLRGNAFAIRMSGAARPYVYALTATEMATTEQVTMRISDVHGRTVWAKTVHPSRDDVREIAWNGRSANGAAVSAGMYMVSLTVVRDGKAAHFLEKTVTLKP